MWQISWDPLLRRKHVWPQRLSPFPSHAEAKDFFVHLECHSLLREFRLPTSHETTFVCSDIPQLGDEHICGSDKNMNVSYLPRLVLYQFCTVLRLYSRSIGQGWHSTPLMCKIWANILQLPGLSHASSCLRAHWQPPRVLGEHSSYQSLTVHLFSKLSRLSSKMLQFCRPFGVVEQIACSLNSRGEFST